MCEGSLCKGLGGVFCPASLPQCLSLTTEELSSACPVPEGPSSLTLTKAPGNLRGDCQQEENWPALSELGGRRSMSVPKDQMSWDRVA